VEYSYIDLLYYVRDSGVLRPNRTGTDTASVFGEQLACDLSKGFPLLTTKKMWWRGVVEELRWFLRGSTNVNDLAESVRKWWTPWAEDDGSIGPTYGKQMRGGDDGFDQLAYVIDLLQSDPNSRRILMSLWNTPEMLKTGLPCCHGTVIQFYVSPDRKLSCHMYQRSADIFIGVPVNIASYALLTHMIAAACNLEVGNYIHSFGALHMYVNHSEHVGIQLSREIRPAPKLKMHLPKKWDSMSALDRVLCFDYDMLEISEYDPHPAIKAPVAV